MFLSRRVLILIQFRNFSTKTKQNIIPNEKVINDIENGLFKPRKHPGIYKPRTIQLPQKFVTAIEAALADYPAKQILTDSQTLVNYLRSRHPPVEHREIINKRKEIEEELLSKEKNDMTNEERVYFKEKLKIKINNVLKSKLYAWKPVNYDIVTCLQYLLGRSTGEYAALVRIFQEIFTRDANFVPRSLFDFGSGVGTATWAAKMFWQKNIFEYFNVDSSVHMNDLALILLKGGTGLGQPNLKGVYYRQFLPAKNISYDLVVCAYSLFELPSSQARLETILNLWNKTKEYLVIVEQGTFAGFKIVNEARDFILQLKNDEDVHVFSPCSHNNICPRFLENTYPCNFTISYMSIPVGQNSELRKELFSYIVLKKGPRKFESSSWPRIVSPTLVRSKHAICRMCTSEGKLQEVIFTAGKHGRNLYRCAKATKLGDQLPVNISTIKEETSID